MSTVTDSHMIRYRQEHDTFGVIDVPEARLWG